MATRKIKDAKDLATNELIYFKGHAKATYMSDGRNVEEAIHQISIGEGGGITAETDPVFSASPAASITEEKIAEWNSKSAQGDKGDKGDTGVGVQSVAQTTTSNADGGTNVVTVTLSNGTTSTFSVKNGSKGSSGSNGTNGTNGKDGADGATFTPSVDSAGNLSWTNNKGLTNPPTVNIKGPKGDAGEGGGSTGGGTIETIDMYGGNGDPLIIDEMLAEKRYYLFISNAGGGEETIEIDSFEGNDASDVLTIKHFYAVICAEGTGSGSGAPDPFNITLILPDVDIKWANSLVPTIVGSGFFELSITQINDYGLVYYNAVLTPFK